MIVVNITVVTMANQEETGIEIAAAIEILRISAGLPRHYIQRVHSLLPSRYEKRCWGLFGCGDQSLLRVWSRVPPPPASSGAKCGDFQVGLQSNRAGKELYTCQAVGS